ncbi:MAG: hypothetical protein ACYTFI_26105 [Planctomycetota bacterium]|jgi:predicted RNA methylase
MKWLAVCAVLGLFAGVVVYKQVSEPEPSAVVTSGAEEAVRVILFADPRQADVVCGCGEIFALVRKVGAEGVSVLEVDPRAGSELTQTHRVVVEPTVIVLDESGEETARFEGEDSTTIAAIGSALEQLRGAP